MRVLLVEDEVRLARRVAEGLEHLGFQVDVEHDGPTGLWRATETAFDAIVLDILLPGMNGFEVCRKLREAEVWAPILMLTAKDGEHDEAEALDTGADDYLRKPFSFVVLAARLRALARRGGGPRPAILRAGDLAVDPAARTCHRGDEPIELTAREFDLLEALLRAGGIPVPKAELLDRVWGSEFDGSVNAVEVYVRYLRRKIDEPFDEPLIETVRGVGYRVAA
ncbi:MAG: response regulator transcription factor [Actinomycetota bacterium]